MRAEWITTAAAVLSFIAGLVLGYRTGERDGYTLGVWDMLRGDRQAREYAQKIAELAQEQAESAEG